MAEQTFMPIRRLAGPITDTSLIDVEVVATTGINPGARFIVPQQRLRFRLERAYVESLSWREGGETDLSSLSLSFDTAGKRPRSISWAELNQDRDKPKPASSQQNDDLGRRTLIINLEGHQTFEKLSAFSAELVRCRGGPERFGLFAVVDDGSLFCRRNSRLRAKSRFVGMLTTDLAVQIVCTNDLIGCRVSFPFGYFAPSIGFHEDRLPDWKAIVSEAEDFLKSKLAGR